MDKDNLQPDIALGSLLTAGISLGLLFAFAAIYPLHGNNFDKNHVDKKIVALKDSLEVDRVCYDDASNIWLILNNQTGDWQYESDGNLEFITLSNGSMIYTSSNYKVFLTIVYPNTEGLFCL